MYAVEPRHGGVCKYEVKASCILQLSLDVGETSVSRYACLFTEEWTGGVYGHLGLEGPQGASGGGGWW